MNTFPKRDCEATKEVLPTKAEAWGALWDALAPHLVQLHIEGKLPIAARLVNDPKHY